MTYSTIGADTTTKQPVTINKTVRPQGLYIVGRQGTGKSGLLENLIIQDIKQGLGVCVIDPHHKGGITDNIIARLPANREKDVILQDMRDYQYPFGLNLFTCSDPTNPLALQEVVDRVMHVFEKLFSVTHDTPLIWEYLYNCTHTIVVNGFTMAEIPLLLIDKHCRQQLVANVKKSEVRLFWQRYDALKPDEQEERSAPTLRRVNALLQDITKCIVGQSKTTIDCRAISDEGKILLVKLDSLTLGDTTNLIGSLIIAAFLNAAPTRLKKQNLFNIYADEFQNFATEDFVKLIEEARKYGIGITIAHQNRSQLELSNKQAEIELKKRVLNVGSLVVFCVPTDAPELSGQFDCTPPPPEIIGWRPVLTPKLDVVDHLVKNGHKNPAVNCFASKYLVPLLDAFRVVKGYWNMSNGRSIFEMNTLELSDARIGIQELNNVLYSCMVDRDPHKAISPYVLLTFGFYFRFAEGVGIGGGSYNEQWKQHFKPKEKTLALCQSDIFSRVNDLKSMIGKKEKFDRAIEFLRSLRSAMEVLASDPVLVNVGAHEAIYDKPRSYQDVQNQVANMLVGLPDYTARVKIKGDCEHLIQTLKPDKGLYGKALQDQIADIQNRNRKAGYTHPRQDIEQEIIKRQSQWSHQSGFQTPMPPQGRKMPTCQSCAANNSQGAKFCNQCGEKL
jgi:hypothetical protein